MVLRQKKIVISKFALTMFSLQQLEKVMKIHSLDPPGTVEEMEEQMKRFLDKPDEDEQCDLSYTADQLAFLVRQFHLASRSD